VIKSDSLLHEIMAIRESRKAFVKEGVDFLRTTNKTPAHEFIQLSCELGPNHLLTTLARDSYQENVALWLLRRASKVWTERKRVCKHIICDDNIYPGSGSEVLGRFDRLVIIPPSFWQNFKGESKTLEKCTWMVQPCFKIEVESDFTPEQFWHRIGRKDKWRIDLLNWNRIIKTSRRGVL
jgi:hypothetical protein